MIIIIIISFVCLIILMYAAMPTPTQSTTPTSPRTTIRPRVPEEVSNKSSSPLPLAALAGALGGILGVILIIFLIARTRKRNSLPPSKKSGDEKEIGGDHLGRSPMLHRNNVPYGKTIYHITLSDPMLELILY